MTEELKCSRCESTEPAKKYDPRTGGHPHKRVVLCDKCAAADPKCILDEGVPVIDPAVPEAAKEAVPTVPEIKDFNVTDSRIATPKNAPPVEPKPEPISTEGTIPREQIVGDLNRRLADVEKLKESHQGLLAQQQSTASKIQQALQMLAIQQGAVAQLRMTLGIKAPPAK